MYRKSSIFSIRKSGFEPETYCFIVSCPELFYGGCHGNDAQSVFAELCQIVEETVQLYQEDGKPLPKPLSGKDFVNTLHKHVA